MTEHTPKIPDPIWRKIAEIYGVGPDQTKIVGNKIREILTEVALNGEAWRSFLRTHSITLPASIPTPVRVDQELLIPQVPVLPPSTSYPPIPAGVDPWAHWAQEAQAQQEQPEKRFIPADYVIPPLGDRGAVFPLQIKSELCAQCNPPIKIEIGEEAYARTNEYSRKEYRHSWHVLGRWV